jgi:hypothetical protein
MEALGRCKWRFQKYCTLFCVSVFEIYHFWSAAARRRFGPSRLDAYFLECLIDKWSRKVAADQSGVEPPHSKVNATRSGADLVRCTDLA